MDIDLRRLVTRHRHVAPMLSAVLAGTDARVIVTDADGTVILHRDTGPSEQADAPTQRYPILLEGQAIGWVEGQRVAAAVAAVLGYAAAREHDKRSLAQEALERYRELNLIYDLADKIGANLNVASVAAVAIHEAGRLPGGGIGFLLLKQDDGSLAPVDGMDTPHGMADAASGVGILGVVLEAEAEIVNDTAGDSRATMTERGLASMIMAPLKVRGERIGIVGATSESPTEYRAADLKVLAAIAALTAPTLDQARAHEALARESGHG